MIRHEFAFRVAFPRIVRRFDAIADVLTDFEALDEVEILSGRLDEVWHDGERVPAPLVYENELPVVHPEGFVTDDGVYIN